jgi:hypothetical protein
MLDDTNAATRESFFGALYKHLRHSRCAARRSSAIQVLTAGMTVFGPEIWYLYLLRFALDTKLTILAILGMQLQGMPSCSRHNAISSC